MVGPVRKYQRIRLGAGDWLLPSNDGQTMYRLLRYDEDGSGEMWDEARQKWRTMRGQWWRVLSMSMITLRQEAARGLDPWDYSWCDIAGPFKTMREATEYVEEVMARDDPQADRRPGGAR